MALVTAMASAATRLQPTDTWRIERQIDAFFCSVCDSRWGGGWSTQLSCNLMAALRRTHVDGRGK
jgi:hypothetical protein